MVQRLGGEFPASFLLEECTATWVRWRVPCHCSSPEDDFLFDIVFDSDTNTVEMRIYGDVYFHENDKATWWERMVERLRFTWKSLTMGYQRYGGELIFKSDEDIRALAQVLMRSAFYLKESNRGYGEYTPDKR